MKYLKLILLVLLLQACATTELHTDDTVGVIACISEGKTAVVDEIMTDCKKSDKEFTAPKKYKKQTMSNIIQYCNRELEKKAQITPDGNVICVSK